MILLYYCDPERLVPMELEFYLYARYSSAQENECSNECFWGEQAMEISGGVAIFGSFKCIREQPKPMVVS